MISFIKGILDDVNEDSVVIDVNGVGYQIGVSSETRSNLDSIGIEVKLYTYMSVREDAISLFGFPDKDDLQMFKKLISVSGIGPKGGLAILSVMTSDSLRYAIATGNAKMIAAAPGIGKKTAERVILELHDKISLDEHSFLTNPKKVSSSLVPDIQGEAVEALVALGYLPQEAAKAVQKIELTEAMDTEAILKTALRNMM